MTLQKRFFLGQDRMLGESPGQNFDDRAFALAVGVGHQIDGAFVVNGLGFVPVGANDLARGLGRLPCSFKKCATVLRHEMADFRNCPSAMLPNGA